MDDVDVAIGLWQAAMASPDAPSSARLGDPESELVAFRAVTHGAVEILVPGHATAEDEKVIRAAIKRCESKGYR